MSLRSLASPTVTQRSIYLNYAREVFAEAARRRMSPYLGPRSRLSVERVVSIVSAARSGSSFLFAALANTGRFTCLASEHTPLYKLAGFGRDDLGLESDKLDDGFRDALAPSRLDTLYDYMKLLFCYGPRDSEPTKKDIIGRMMARLALQWPELAIPHDDLGAICTRALDATPPQRKGDDTVARSYLAAIAAIEDELRTRELRPYYDLAAPRGRATQRLLPPPSEDFVIEEPPFVAEKTGHSSGRGRCRPPIILLKASIDAYYFPMLVALFPNADIKVIYLHRNPASGINGLMDGWTKGTFYSHNVGGEMELHIPEYSARFPQGNRWWKFELPPRWRDMAQCPLQDVCAEQWKAANQSIFSHVERRSASVLRVKYEDLVKGQETFAATLSGVLSFAGVHDVDSATIKLSEFPLYMATSEERLFRWKKKEPALLGVLDDSEIRELINALGYESRAMDREWI